MIGLSLLKWLFPDICVLNHLGILSKRLFYLFLCVLTGSLSHIAVSYMNKRDLR